MAPLQGAALPCRGVSANGHRQEELALARELLGEHRLDLGGPKRYGLFVLGYSVTSNRGVTTSRPTDNSSPAVVRCEA